jgi:hypothetical protein
MLPATAVLIILEESSIMPLSVSKSEHATSSSTNVHTMYTVTEAVRAMITANMNQPLQCVLHEVLAARHLAHLVVAVAAVHHCRQCQQILALGSVLGPVQPLHQRVTVLSSNARHLLPGATCTCRTLGAPWRTACSMNTSSSEYTHAHQF